jgi:hypothetical protein
MTNSILRDLFSNKTELRETPAYQCLTASTPQQFKKSMEKISRSFENEDQVIKDFFLKLVSKSDNKEIQQKKYLSIISLLGGTGELLKKQTERKLRRLAGQLLNEVYSHRPDLTKFLIQEEIISTFSSKIRLNADYRSSNNVIEISQTTELGALYRKDDSVILNQLNDPSFTALMDNIRTVVNLGDVVGPLPEDEAMAINDSSSLLSWGTLPSFGEESFGKQPSVSSSEMNADIITTPQRKDQTLLDVDPLSEQQQGAFGIEQQSRTTPGQMNQMIAVNRGINPALIPGINRAGPLSEVGGITRDVFTSRNSASDVLIGRTPVNYGPQQGDIPMNDALGSGSRSGFRGDAPPLLRMTAESDLSSDVFDMRANIAFSGDVGSAVGKDPFIFGREIPPSFQSIPQKGLMTDDNNINVMESLITNSLNRDNDVNKLKSMVALSEAMYHNQNAPILSDKNLTSISNRRRKQALINQQLETKRRMDNMRRYDLSQAINSQKRYNELYKTPIYQVS